MELLKSINQLIFPSRCISCKTLGEPLCRTCSVGWIARDFKSNISRDPGIVVYSAVEYSEIAARVILAAKESHLKSADRLVADAISHSLHQCLAHEWVDTVIPIPSRKNAARKRGRQFIEEMARIVAQPVGIPIATPLAHSRLVRDQSGLGYQQRWNNLEGALVVTGKSEGLGRVLLIDDLVTTGATLNEAARALRYAGIEVIGAVTAAITQTVR